MTQVLHCKIPFIRNICINKQIQFAPKLTAVRLKAISTFNMALHLINEMCKEIKFMMLNIYFLPMKVLMR